ncbi:hypothetical protein [Phytohabitans kaempferiae]|uniref:NTP pyrophosphohydrolase MazG putative catalytic core domain-containing protein n=1 Tax=Phytohabitans kaempferiae TaxID=1620943 RepID=A0ABV6MBY8_9ACTN
MTDGTMTVEDVIDQPIRDLARALKPAQRSMHASWRQSNLYYQHVDELAAAAPDQAVPFITAAKLAGINIHLGRALDAVRSSPHQQDSIDQVTHNLVDILLGVLDLAEYLDADLGQQLTEQLDTAMRGFTARQPKRF